MIYHFFNWEFLEVLTRKNEFFYGFIFKFITYTHTLFERKISTNAYDTKKIYYSKKNSQKLKVHSVHVTCYNTKRYLDIFKLKVSFFKKEK